MTNLEHVHFSESVTLVNVELSFGERFRSAFICTMNEKPPSQGLTVDDQTVTTARQISIWLADPKLTGDRIAVLIAILDHSDAAGRCWPSQGRIAGQLGWSRSRICRLIGELQEMGYLITEFRKRPNGGNASKLYRLCCARFNPGMGAGQGAKPMSSGAQDPVAERDRHRTEPNKEDLSNAEGAVFQNGSQGEGSFNSEPIPQLLSTWEPTAATRLLGEQLRPDLEFDEVLNRFRIVFAGQKICRPDDAWRKWFARERFCRKGTTSRPQSGGGISRPQHRDVQLPAVSKRRVGFDHPNPRVRQLAVMDFGARFGLARKMGLERGWSQSEIKAAARDPELLARSEIPIPTEAE